jgi:large subunit ribosomal protein L25
MHQLTLAALERESKGKGAARKLRKNNQLPAIFYGPTTQPIKLAINYPEFERITKRSGFENTILDLKITSRHGEETRKAMVKELMIDPVKDFCIHADFYEISMDKEITVDIPIRLVNTPIGLTNGGLLQVVRRELTISCLPDKLIDSLDIDVSGLDIGDSVHIRDIALPEGMSCVEEGDITVAIVSAPAGGLEGTPGEEIEEETAASEKGAAEGAKGKKKGGDQ